MASSSVFSQTLQEITTTKLEELAKKRTLFEQHKGHSIRAADSQDDPLDSLNTLADGCKACFGISTSKSGSIVRGSSKNPRLEGDLRNLKRFIDQARFDPSVSSRVVQQWRQTLLDHLEKQSLKYQYADLYGQLTMEWLESSIPAVKGKGADDMEISDDYEEVSKKAKIEARQAWERGVFNEAQVDQQAIEQFLKQLFGGKATQKALKQLRSKVSSIEHSFSNSKQFNHHTLGWTIKSLLSSDLLSNEKRQVLRDFQSNTVILTELGDVLNMRMAALKTWSWGSSVPVEARRQLNGRYNIYMHEDLLQAIFLQYIGIIWSTRMKSALMDFQNDKNVWNHGLKKLSPLDRQRRQWYLSQSGHGKSVQQIRTLSYRAGYFVSQLMDQVDQDLEVEEGDEEADFAEFAGTAKRMAVQQAPRKQMASQAARKSVPGHYRGRSNMEEQAECEEDDSDDDMGFGAPEVIESSPLPDLTPYKPKNPMDAKQRLLHLLSTEILVRTEMQGSISCFRSQFEAWNPSLPHATIITTLSFLGVSDDWLNFFRTFLKAPLKFINEEEEPRVRKRGTPGAHALSEVFGESILFCLDFEVNQRTEGEVLWRMHDDFWFWSSSHDTCVQTWQVIHNFNKTMGLQLDESKSAAIRMQKEDDQICSKDVGPKLPHGEIRWGMIYLDDKTGRFTIDRAMVDKHIEELRRQLKEKERSIFSWVQAYSTYASIFFISNFGKPANCFGREHLDSMLGMHERIQKTLFNDDPEVNSVVDWLKIQLEKRFGVKDVPDGYLFFPISLGGLEVRSPFIGLLQLRDSITKDPTTLFTDFAEAQQEQYEMNRKRYLERKAWQYPKREGEYRPENPYIFMSFAEYTKFREELNYGFSNQLVDVYESLLKRPREEPLENDYNTGIHEALNHINHGYGPSQTMTSWHSMTPYWKWVTMLYGPEMAGSTLR